MIDAMIPLFAGWVVVLAAAPLGCFVVWRKMAYFGDALSHSALLGVALGMVLGLNDQIAILLVAFGFASLLLWLQHFRLFSIDTLLGILAHAALSVGLVIIALLSHESHEGGSHASHDHAHEHMHELLFGDLMSVTQNDLIIMIIGALVVLGLIRMVWQPLCLMVIHHDLAKAEGIDTKKLQTMFTLMLALVVAMAVQVVGVLLITSMLIIPAATARQVARSPSAMALIAMAIGLVSVASGLIASDMMHTPVGPTIVTFTVIWFVVMIPLSSYAARKKHPRNVRSLSSDS